MAHAAARITEVNLIRGHNPTIVRVLVHMALFEARVLSTRNGNPRMSHTGVINELAPAVIIIVIRAIGQHPSITILRNVRMAE